MQYKIKPTSKERKRYLLVKIDYQKNLSAKEVENIIVNACLEFLGELYFSRASVIVLLDTWKNEKIIIKTSHKYVDEVKVAFALIKEINGLPIRLSVTKVSGTIKGLKDK